MVPLFSSAVSQYYFSSHSFFKLVPLSDIPSQPFPLSHSLSRVPTHGFSLQPFLVSPISLLKLLPLSHFLSTVPSLAISLPSQTRNHTFLPSQCILAGYIPRRNSPEGVVKGQERTGHQVRV